MKICSITLTSRTREAIIGDALRSVDWCDLNLVAHLIDEPGEDRTLEVAREVAGPRYLEGEVRLLKNIAQARTWALDWAASTGCDWAVQVDTDANVAPKPYSSTMVWELVFPPLRHCSPSKPTVNSLSV